MNQSNLTTFCFHCANQWQSALGFLTNLAMPRHEPPVTWQNFIRLLAKKRVQFVVCIVIVSSAYSLFTVWTLLPCPAPWMQTFAWTSTCLTFNPAKPRLQRGFNFSGYLLDLQFVLKWVSLWVNSCSVANLLDCWSLDVKISEEQRHPSFDILIFGVQIQSATTCSMLFHAPFCWILGPVLVNFKGANFDVFMSIWP